MHSERLAGLDLAGTCTAADWPTWRGDAARSAVTAERLPSALTLHWKLHLPTPRPAWPDEQGKVRFDASYEPVVAGDTCSCRRWSTTAWPLIDSRTARLVWRFYADGPVRFAPVVHGDRVLFVSDDGYLYCVTADRGSLVVEAAWRSRHESGKLLGNDRLISMWPARGAPVVCGETVYWAAGIWPFMGVFVHAVDIGYGTTGVDQQRQRLELHRPATQQSGVCRDRPARIPDGQRDSTCWCPAA